MVVIDRIGAMQRVQKASELISFRDKLQSMCYWYAQGHKHGECKQMDGMAHICTFCELVEELDRILK